jgi:hypothetical protein
MSDYSGSPSDHQLDFQPPKRKATQAGLDGHPAGRSVKRRASKACQCCRARKVRCNVTEHGAPCTNCRLDEVDCIVSESRRKKLVSLLVHHPTLSTRQPELLSNNESRHYSPSNVVMPCCCGLDPFGPANRGVSFGLHQLISRIPLHRYYL